MALNSVLVCCFIALCTWDLALGCTWMQSRLKGTRSNFKVVNSYSIMTLEQMGDEATPGKDSPVFPDKLYEHAEKLQAEERVTFIHDTISDILKLYISGKLDAVTWDKKKLDNFQLDLDRQASELKQCIQSQSSQPSHPVRRLNRKMKEHFRKLYDLLKNKKYSTESWEIVRSEVLTHLRRLDILAIQNPTSSSPEKNKAEQ